MARGSRLEFRVMNYDSAIKEIETIVRELEQADAISVQAYKEKAQQAKKLLDFCEGELRQMEQQFTCG